MKLALILALFFGICLEADAQHMNSPEAPCRNLGGTSDMVQCFSGELDKQNAELNKTYQATLHSLKIKAGASNKTDEDQLRASERLWMQFRDTNCKAEYELYEGGSAAPTVRLACEEEMTRKRVEELKTMYGWVMEKWN